MEKHIYTAPWKGLKPGKYSYTRPSWHSKLEKVEVIEENETLRVKFNTETYSVALINLPYDAELRDR